MGPLESIWDHFGQLLISRWIEKRKGKERKDGEEGKKRNERKEGNVRKEGKDGNQRQKRKTLKERSE